MPETPVEVLLVEDNPNDVELTIHVLKRHCGIQNVQVVRDGVEALEFLFCTGAYAYRSLTNPPKVILLDLKLPRVDGKDVLRRLKGDPRTQPIPVVILTSSSDERDITDCYQIGVNSFIVKPVDYDQFIEVTRTLGVYWLSINHPFRF